MGQADECSVGFQGAIGITRDGKVCIDFCGRKVGLMEMTVEEAFRLAEALVETGLEAAKGIQIPTPGIVALGKH